MVINMEEENMYEKTEGELNFLHKEIDSLKQRIKMLEELVTKNSDMKNQYEVLSKLVTSLADDINDLKNIYEVEKYEKE